MPGTFAPGEYADVTRASDARLAADVDRVLGEMKADGALGEILQRWGLWDESQREVGTAKGRPQEVIPEARGAAAGDSAVVDAIAPAVARGAWMTVLLTVIAMPLATAAGLALALARMSPRAWRRRAAIAYFEMSVCPYGASHCIGPRAPQSRFAVRSLFLRSARAVLP